MLINAPRVNFWNDSMKYLPSKVVLCRLTFVPAQFAFVGIIAHRNFSIHPILQINATKPSPRAIPINMPVNWHRTETRICFLPMSSCLQFHHGLGHHAIIVSGHFHDAPLDFLDCAYNLYAVNTFFNCHFFFTFLLKTYYL